MSFSSRLLSFALLVSTVDAAGCQERRQLNTYVDVNDPNYDDVNTFEPDSDAYLQNQEGTDLNSGYDETEGQKTERLSGQVPAGMFDQEFDPLEKAVCFNEPYKTDFGSIDQVELYKDYARIFDWGFANSMGAPLQGESPAGVTKNRLPGMMLRMCFHDNAINTDLPHFQDYIDNYVAVDDIGWTRWTGPGENLETSGADASVLVCSKERFHPNQNDDETASRVLFSLQSKDIPGITHYDGKQTNMVSKYKLSYADLLHNGCVAAAIYLRPTTLSKLRGDLSSVLEETPMRFGRKDACRYMWHEETRSALCGPSELLPGLALNTKESNDWFQDRGMTSCQFMALMWTHSTLAPLADAVGNACPLMKLPCTTSEGTKLDYFSHFLQRGKHVVASVDAIAMDGGAPNCEWTPVTGKCGAGPPEEWPLTAIDCTLSLDVATAAAKKNRDDEALYELKEIIKNFHLEVYPPEKVLMCALRMLGGKGNKHDCAVFKDTSCTEIGTDSVPDDHMFGGYYGHP
jgi:hypothetical protein